MNEQIVTVTYHQGHEVRQAHNRREPQVVKNEKHIRQDGNYEIWFDIPEAEAYRRIFGPAQDSYNVKQKRADRRIKDYHEQVRAPYDAIITAQRAAVKYNEDNREAIKAGELKAQPIPELPRTMTKPSYEVIVGVYGKKPRLDEQGRPQTDAETGEQIYDPDPIPEREVNLLPGITKRGKIANFITIRGAEQSAASPVFIGLFVIFALYRAMRHML